MTKKIDYSFTPIQEQVAPEDLFEDRTHERVASSLKSFISNTDKGMTIGLEGAWGSGKSTVINLLRKELREENEKVLFFAFDAWAHDGDPLRKIFLERLITTIDPLSSDEVLNNLRERVSARKKSVVVDTNKSASGLGKILSASALPIPIGAALLSAVNYENLLWPFTENSGSMNFPFFFGLLLSTAPLWAIAYWARYGDRDKKTKKVEWEIFKATSKESYTQDITEDGERTSIEFEKFFNEIISHLYSKESSYDYSRVVIVIDNLDRVEADYAQNIWSTLQTFFQHRSSSIGRSERPWADKLWFLIPYDRYGLRRVWSNSNMTHNTLNDQIAESFMEKCFQVISEVPTPVISTWINYFQKCIKNSLSGWPESRKVEFSETYIRCMSKLEKSPSPRQMHNHINRAGMLALHWKGKITAEAISLYALYRQTWTAEELRAELLDDGLPKQYPNMRPVLELKREVAGLLFGVTPDKGMQLLLTPEIKLAFSEGDGDTLSDLAVTYQSAFWVSIRACQNDWMVTDSHTDQYKLNVVAALASAFVNAKSQVRDFIEPIEEAFLNSFDNWNIKNYSYYNALNSLLALSSDKESLLSRLRQLVSAKFKRSLSRINEEDIPEQELASWSGFERLLENHSQPLVQNHNSKMDINQWQSWMNKCDSAEVTLNSVLPDKKTYSALVNAVGFNQPKLNQEKLELLTKTLKIDPNMSRWAGLNDALINWFNLGNRDVESESAYALALQIHGVLSKEEREKLKGCISQQEFWRRGALSSLSTNPSLPFLVATCCDDFKDNSYISSEVKQYLSNELPDQDIEVAFHSFKRANAIDRIWYQAGPKNALFAKQIIRTIKDNTLFEYGGFWFDEIEWDTEQEIVEITDKLCTNGAIKRIKSSIESRPNAFHKAIMILLEHGDENSSSFCSQIVNNLSREQWFKALQAHNCLLSCVPDSSSTFSKAWADFLKAIVKGEESEPSQKDLKAVLELSNKVLDLEASHEPEILSAFFDSPDEDVLSDQSFEELSELFAKHLNSVERGHLDRKISLWIENNNISRLNWFIDTEYKVKGNPTEDIIASVRHRIENGDEEVEVFISLNNKLKLGIDLETLTSDKKDSHGGNPTNE